MQIEELSLNAIKPYERNPRKNDSAVNGVAESIKQFGFKQPIVIDKDNVIVAGHTRYKAAKKLGLKAVPCVRADDLTAEQVKAYRLLDNKLNELATWDFSVLSDELQTIDMSFDGFDIELPKFNVESEPNTQFVSNTNQGGNHYAVNDERVAYQQPTGGGNAQQVSATTIGENVINEENLPEELHNVNITPEPLPPMKGNDRTEFDRIIIVFKEEDKEKLCKLLGVEQITKIVYHIEEFL